MPTVSTLHPAVRVLLVDPADRVLMVRWRLADGRGVWGVPGGGIEPGESHAEEWYYLAAALLAHGHPATPYETEV